MSGHMVKIQGRRIGDDGEAAVREVLVEELDVGAGTAEGRAAHQGPEVDGSTTLLDAGHVAVGDLLTATVVASEGADLVAALRAPSR